MNFLPKLTCPVYVRGALLLTLLLISPFPLIAGPEESEERHPRSEVRGPKGTGDGRDRWEGLSREDQEKLKSALREVWTDPGVISAREDVRKASEGYQVAIRTAIGKADPSVAHLLKKVQAATAGKMESHVGGLPAGRFGPRRMGEYPMGPPGFMEKLSPEERELFKKAESAAKESDSVRKAKKEFEELRKQDETLRRRRMEAYRKMRVALLNSMVEAEPSLKEKIDELRGSHPRGKGKPPGKD